jgi:ABC-2 type transport system ATP-binding protein
MTAALELRSVTKRFGSLEALADVSLSVRIGAAFGLLGPNGAGKTTLIRLVTGILGPDSGEILLGGQPASGRQSSSIGYMPEERGLYRRMGVEEHLLYLARLKEMPKAEARQSIRSWLQRLELAEWALRPIEDLSKGMQQKVQFIATVIHRPALLILDEPFSGLDPISTQLIAREIHTLRQDGTTVIFSTHRMEQVQEICSEIALIHRGRVLLSGAVRTIREQYRDPIAELEYRGTCHLAADSAYQVIEQDEGLLRIRLLAPHAGNRVLQKVVEQGADVVSYREILPSLNDVFIRLVNQSEVHE